MSNNFEKGLPLNDYLKEIVQNQIGIFNELTKWSEEDKTYFAQLLNRLNNSEDDSTKEKGNLLENVVEFIIKKTYFFDIYKNVRTNTNEIHEVIVLSDRGKQALHQYNISRDLIPIEGNIFIGECKNYKEKLGVTYVGKFYSLMCATSINLGILFTINGLTGKSFEDATGLVHILCKLENIRNNKPFNIITFCLDDYYRLLNGETFYEIIKAKKISLQLSSNYTNFLNNNKHEAEDEIKNIIEQIQY